MEWEVELKYRVRDLAAVRAAAVALGAEFRSMQQADTYFNHPARDFAATDEALRLRRVGEATFITYKGPRIDRATKTRKELELPLGAGPAAFDGFSELLAALGFRAVATVRKERQEAGVQWQGVEIHIALDDVRDVGVYVELETIASEHSLASAKAAIALLAAHLGLVEAERRSYLDLLLERTARIARVPRAEAK